MLKSKFQIKRAHIISIGFLSFIFWVIYSANTGQSNSIFRFIQETPYGDKLGHFSLFGLLTLAINYGLNFRKTFIPSILIGTLAVFIFAVLEELSQYYIPTRTLDFIDFIADVLGILLFDWVSKKIGQHKID